MAKFCTNCGNPVADGVAFCTACGNPVPQDLTAAQAAQPQFTEDQQRDLQQWSGNPPAEPQPQFVDGQQSYGDTSSGAYAPPSPQGEGYPQHAAQSEPQALFVDAQQAYGQQYGQPYPQGQQGYGALQQQGYTQQPYGAQQYPQQAAQPQFVDGQQAYGQQPVGNINPGVAGQPVGNINPGVAGQPVGNMNAGYAGQPYGQPQYQQPYGYGYPQQPAKKSNKGMWIAIIAIILVLGLAAVALFVWPGFLAKKGVEGKWINDRTGFALEFKDGKATVSSDATDTSTEYSFTQDGDKLRLEKDGDALEYLIKVIGDALTLYYEDDGVSFPETYTRDGAEIPDGREIVGRWGNDNIDEFIIDDDTIREIGEDADGAYDISFTYTREGDKLTITEDQNPENTFVRTYEVEDGELTLKDEDGNVTSSFKEKGGSELVKASYGDFTGTWLNETGDEIIIGVGTLVGVDGSTYTLEYDDVNFKVYLPNSGYIEEYTYDYRGNELELFNKDTGNHIVTLTRKKPATADVPQSDLYGKWISVNDPDEYFVFNADGTGVYWDEDFTYTLTDGVFELKNDLGTYTYSYKINDNILTLIDEKNDENYDYYRDGTTPPPAEVDPYILGRWESAYGEELNIYADGSGDYDGDSITVSTNNGMLYWTADGETEYYTYELKDGVLVITDDTGSENKFYRPGADVEQNVTLDDLVGSWQTDDGYAMVITSDGYLTMSGDGTKYKIEINGDKMRLYIEYSEYDETTRFLLSGDDLKFLEDDGEIISIYHRQKQ